MDRAAIKARIEAEFMARWYADGAEVTLRRMTDRMATLEATRADLLAVLEMLCDGLEWNIDNIIGMNESDSEALAAARALIAKVKGES